jgi:hypothetical protein
MTSSYPQNYILQRSEKFLINDLLTSPLLMSIM